MRQADVAQRRAARLVGAVGIALHGHLRGAADLGKDRGGNAVGRVAGVGVVLEHDAAVRDGTLAAVGLIGVVGMHGVRVVRRHHEAVCGAAQIIALVKPERKADAPQHVGEKARIRALLAGAAYLFVVENAQSRQTGRIAGLEEAAQAAEHALQIVEPGRGDEFVLRAPDRAGRAGIEKQILREKFLLFHAEGFRGESVGAFRTGEREQRRHVRAHIVALAFVRAAVHVDGEVGDQRDGASEVQQPRDEFAPLAQRDAPGNRERAVQPRGAEHPAVFFHAQSHVAVGRDNGVLLELEAGRIAVRGGEQKADRGRLRHAEGDQRRAVAAHESARAGDERPALRLLQLGKARVRKGPGRVLHGVKGGGGAGNERKQFFVEIHHQALDFCSVKASISYFPRFEHHRLKILTNCCKIPAEKNRKDGKRYESIRTAL